MTIERRHVGKRLSDIVIFTPRRRALVYLAGQVADDPTPDITGQTQQVLAQIDRLLAEAGTDKSQILSATIFLPDIGDFAAMNAVWEAWVVAGRDAGARDRRGEARRARLPGRDPGRRRRSTLDAMTASDRRTTPRSRPGDRRRDLAARRRAPSPANAATLPVTREMFDQWMVPLLRAGAVHPGARRRLARLGPGRPDVHRLRERRRGHRARPLPSGAGPRADRAGAQALARVELVHQRAGAAARASASSTRRSPSACSSATPAPRPTRRR